MLGASVWLVSDVACKQSIQQVRESREALHVGRCVEERRGGSGGAAVHGGGTCLGELCVTEAHVSPVSERATASPLATNLFEAGLGVIARKGAAFSVFFMYYSGGNRLHSLSVT